MMDGPQRGGPQTPQSTPPATPTDAPDGPPKRTVPAVQPKMVVPVVETEAEKVTFGDIGWWGCYFPTGALVHRFCFE